MATKKKFKLMQYLVVFSLFIFLLLVLPSYSEKYCKSSINVSIKSKFLTSEQNIEINTLVDEMNNSNTYENRSIYIKAKWHNGRFIVRIRTKGNFNDNENIMIDNIANLLKFSNTKASIKIIQAFNCNSDNNTSETNSSSGDINETNSTNNTENYNNTNSSNNTTIIEPKPTGSFYHSSGYTDSISNYNNTNEYNETVKTTKLYHISGYKFLLSFILVMTSIIYLTYRRNKIWIDTSLQPFL